MIERYIFKQTRKIQNPSLRDTVEHIARLVLENWFYVLAVLFLWFFPQIVGELTDSPVKPETSRGGGKSFLWQRYMAQALIVACLAMSYNLLFGFAGIISFGHALFFGAGGYITFLAIFQYDTAVQDKALIGLGFAVVCLGIFTRISTRYLFVALAGGIALVFLLLPDNKTLSFYQAAILAVLGSIALSVLSALVTIRLKGVYFAMFTLALAEMFYIMVKSLTEITGGEVGKSVRNLIPEDLNIVPGDNRLDVYYITLGFFIIVFVAIRRYLNSPVGRVVMAIRENEERARAIGYNVFYYKLVTMIFAGIIATLSGVLFVLWGAKQILPESLSLKYTINPLLYTLIGGVGTFTGPIIAALGLGLGENYLHKNEFTLSTEIAGLIALWRLIVLTGVLLFFWAIRRPLRESADYILDFLHRHTNRARHIQTDTRSYEWFLLGYIGGVVILVSLVVLLVGNEVYKDSDMGTKVYKVSDYWQLFLGALFIIVVMVLPHGLVGTWNRWQFARRVRRMEEQLRQQKENAA